jgi:hypothetical protein
MRRFALLLWPILAVSALAAEPSGEQIFKTKCATCHGAHGEGAKKYKKPLEGDRSAAQLAALIAETMPESDPGSLSAGEAKAVAGYIYDAFYSRLARDRNRPARIELARLTVRQYRNAVADLVGSFHGPAKWGEQRGLKGEYFSGRRFGGNARILERTDPQVTFDFGTESPVPGKIEPHEFSIRWNGSILAPETGEYEFVVRTEHATRLWVNDRKPPLIDAWVKSGNDTEYKASLYLVAGRVYPLRLEFSKAKQGVDDSKKEKTKPPAKKASIALLWKRPFGALEPIPARQLAPETALESFVCSTPFPPDDRSYGWERGTTISQAWDQATTDAALEAAGYVVAHLDELAGVKAVDREPRAESGNPSDINLDPNAGGKPIPDREKKLRQFCQTFAERAFRRPLTKELAKVIIEKQFEIARNPDVAVKRVVILVLKSPEFLYRELDAKPDAFDAAARLSFGLWDSIPDEELFSAAAASKLASKEQIAKQAQRMLTDPRAKAKIHEFLLTWLKADQPADLAKDAKRFPGFDGAVISDLRTSLELFLDDVVWSDQSDFRQLFLSNEVFLNGRLEKFYGTEIPAPADFTRVALDNDRRAGVLTHPYLMTSFAHSTESSPIHRGVFLARGVLGLSLRPPPEAVAPLPPNLHPTLTTRERVSLQTQAHACMTCHAIINPLGFTLENFDAVGRYREQDHGKAVDATGSYKTRSGQTFTVKGARELGAFLAGSDEAHEAFVEQMFHHLVQQPVRAYGANTLDELKKSFAANRFNIRKLAVEIMVESVMKGRKAEEKSEIRIPKSEINPSKEYQNLKPE